MDIPGARLDARILTSHKFTQICDLYQQAMVHELLTIQNNRVDLRDLGNKVGIPACAHWDSCESFYYLHARLDEQVAKENQELVLSAEQDSFFRAQMYSNYGTVLHLHGAQERPV